jgi:hypothetical protein
MKGSPNSLQSDRRFAMRNANNNVDAALGILRAQQSKKEEAVDVEESSMEISTQDQQTSAVLLPSPTNALKPTLGVYTPSAGSFVAIRTTPTAPMDHWFSHTNTSSEENGTRPFGAKAEGPASPLPNQESPINHQFSLQIPPMQDTTHIISSTNTHNGTRMGTTPNLTSSQVAVDLRTELIHRLNEVEWLSQALESDSALQQRYQFSLRAYHHSLHKWQSFLLEKQTFIQNYQLSLQNWQNTIRIGQTTLRGYDSSLQNWQMSLGSWQASMQDWQTSLQTFERSILSHLSSSSFHPQTPNLTPTGAEHISLIRASPSTIQSTGTNSAIGVLGTLKEHLGSNDPSSTQPCSASTDQLPSVLNISRLDSSERVQGWLHQVQSSPRTLSARDMGVESNDLQLADFPQMRLSEAVVKKEPEL